MNLPCKDCLILPVCIGKSKDYDYMDSYLDWDIYKKCFDESEDYDLVEILLAARWFLNPNLKYGNLFNVGQEIYDKAKEIYENTM